MKFTRHPFLSRVFLTVMIAGLISCKPHHSTELFNGKDLHGWEGDTVHIWKVAEGAIVGGSLTETVPHNDFLCTKKSYDDFILKLKFKMTGHEGFQNAGIQFRSQRLPDPSYEMIGYQADIGEGYFGALYDESRRNKVLAGMDSLAVSKIVKRDQWNEYEIRAEGKRIQLYLNGRQTVDYTERDDYIPQTGIIGLQIHGGGKVQVSYKDLELVEL